MNKQRKVLITVTYNEMGIIVDTKAEELDMSAQLERTLYANMSDAEFEEWLYEHGICHPNIHESIQCDVVPLLIDNAISELPSAQPESCEGCKWENAFGYGECGRCRRRLEDMYERGTCENE